MKKILVLTLMMLLGMYVMASDYTISGEVLYEWYGDLGVEYEANTDAEVVVKAQVDDFNMAEVDFDYEYDAAYGPNMITLDRAYFVTAIGKLAGLEEMGVTLDLTWGYNEYDNASYAQIDHHEIADIWEAKFESWGFGVDIGVMDMVHFEVAMAPQPNDNDGANGELDTIIGVYGGMDPVWVEVYFIRENEALEDGNIGITALFGMDVMPGMFAFKVQASFDYDLDEDMEVDDGIYGVNLGYGLTLHKYKWSAAIATTIMDILYVDVGAAGSDDSMFARLWAAAGIGYEVMADFSLGVDVGLGMVLDDELVEEMLDEIEASVWTKLGAAKFRVGYLMHADQKGGPNFYPGLYAPGDGDYDYTVAESGVLFVSGELDY
jgi:hypothetical protein